MVSCAVHARLRTAVPHHCMSCMPVCALLHCAMLRRGSAFCLLCCLCLLSMVSAWLRTHCSVYNTFHECSRPEPHVTMPMSMSMSAPYARGCGAGLKAGSRQKASLRKKPVVKRQKKNGKTATADLMGDAADTVLQGQQQVMGDLSQAILHWSDRNAAWLHNSLMLCLEACFIKYHNVACMTLSNLVGLHHVMPP